MKILNDSTRIISKLQLLSVFFGDEAIYKIYLRSQVIHKLFESNEELDINKLDLFHLQFTESILELLRKIKKNNEKNENILYDEIQINRDLMEKLNDSVYTEANFKLDRQRQSLKMNLSLRKLYEVLSSDAEEYPFSKNINAFSARFSQDFFYDISPETLGELIGYNPAEVYIHTYATIQKKLMGHLCKNEFKTEFFYGLKAGNQIVEIYKFMEEERYFMYYPGSNLFLFCDLSKISGIDWSNTLSKKARIIRELTDKNNKLESSIGVTKTFIPADIRHLLTESNKKIGEINFLENSDFDVQANILKTMLRTDSI
ncbi:hypothetical protein ACX0G9_14630 [Flavitalea flava]